MWLIALLKEVGKKVLVRAITKILTGNTLKEVVKVGAKEILDRTGINIDDTMSSELMESIKASNGNKIKDIAITEATDFIVDELNGLKRYTKGFL